MNSRNVPQRHRAIELVDAQIIQDVLAEGRRVLAGRREAARQLREAVGQRKWTSYPLHIASH
jgi:hypothetical protein